MYGNEKVNTDGIGCSTLLKQYSCASLSAIIADRQTMGQILFHLLGAFMDLGT